MNTIDCNRAAEIIFDFFKRHQWLIAPPVMRTEDAACEQEAVQALLAFSPAKQWQGVSEGAQRVASSLLLDFLAKLMMNSPAWQRQSFEINPAQSEDEQAMGIVVGEILRNHPHLAKWQ